MLTDAVFSPIDRTVTVAGTPFSRAEMALTIDAVIATSHLVEAIASTLSRLPDCSAW